MTPKVSIIVIAHSVRSELERCFASIRRHSGDRPVETILVDNASTDDTVAWTRSEFPEVRIVELEENLGAAARDVALPLTRGELTMFLDSDAALTAGALPAMIDALRVNPDWGLIGPRLVYDDGSLQLSCRRYPPLLLPLMRRPPLARLLEDSPAVRRHLMSEVDHGRAREVLYVIGACQLFRTEIARRIGGFDRRTFLGWSDADWCIRVRDAGGKVIYLPDATVIHSYRRMTTRKPASRAALRQLDSHVRFQWRYRARRRELLSVGEDVREASEAVNP